MVHKWKYGFMLSKFEGMCPIGFRTPLQVRPVNKKCDVKISKTPLSLLSQTNHDNSLFFNNFHSNLTAKEDILI